MVTKRIGFFYPDFFPIQGGSSVHGYFLAKELTSFGYQLNTCTSQQTPFSIPFKKNIFSLFNMILQSDLIYIRPSLLGKSMYLPMLAKKFGKKVIVELNGPSDELIVTKNYSQSQIEKTDLALKRMLTFADAVITVTDILSNYCKATLQAKQVYVVENGGQKYFPQPNHRLKLVQESIGALKLKYEKLVVWSGTNYAWQGFTVLRTLIESSNSKIAFCIITNDITIKNIFSSFEHVKIFYNLDFEQANELVLNADVGLALYGDYSWSRFKDCYGSSLKYYEYIANDLAVIATPTGHMKEIRFENTLHTHDISKMIEFILESKKIRRNKYRSWTDVASETNTIIQNI